MTVAPGIPAADEGTASGVPPARRVLPGRMPGRLRPRLPRLRAAVRDAAPALLGFAAVRAVGVGVLLAWGHRRGRPAVGRLSTLWDAKWYADIAAHGYDRAIPAPDAHGHAYTNLAFFPLYPWLIRVVRALTPLATAHAALLVAWAASLAAAWGIFAVTAGRHGRRAGALAAVLWGVLPHAVIESAAYTEALFTALAAWSLHAVLARHWVRAGALCCLAGLTRPSAVALVAAIGAAAAAELVRIRRGRRPDAAADGTVPGAAWWRPCLGALIAPLGWLGFVAWVGARLGRWDGYFAVQMLWDSHVDWGRSTAHSLRGLIVHAAPVPLGRVVVVLVLLAALVLLAVSVAQRQPLALLAYGAGVMAIALGDAAYLSSRARFLLPAFPLLLPLATGLARVRSRSTRAILVCSAALLSAAYGGYLVYASRLTL
ncbi:hypothetical protein LO771_16075 [Streptacidiphilus sp. ASG 303]|uniref:hypothetical protein n=1 Tax=Streptacidiphilus sp. ASG 303 TaxID=2896847 RepID=UPI001E2DBA42|nr:hypothetical protein [Streptacidiphilus sp. ASG 303]MCD0483872.1 hypothetical protein [Streptacidiphilus sp. ASG 303]